MPFFELLQVPISFEVDLTLLKANYHEMQRLYHPDYIADRVEMSALINKAYKTLTDPLSRAEHILHINGVFITEDDKMDYFEFMEKIFDIRSKLDDASPEEAEIGRAHV